MAIVAPPAPTYCFDTSIFIDGMGKRYPPIVFGSVWEYVERLIKDGRIRSPREVMDEIERYDDDVFKWVKSRRQFIVDEDDATQIAAAEVMKEYPGFVAKGNERACADPFVIAMARAHNLVVVSQEELVATHRKTKPKIPNACLKFGVECLDIVKFLVREGIRI